MNERIETAAGAPAPLPEGRTAPYTRSRDEPGETMTREAAQPAGRSAGASREPLTRTERLLVTMFVTMFGTMLAAGALAFTTLSGQMLDIQNQMLDLQKQMSGQMLDLQKQMSGQMLDFQEQMSGQMLDLQKQTGELSERIVRVETLIETHLVPQSGATPPSGG